MRKHIQGSFDVKVSPVSAGGEPLMRMSIDKRFAGELDATGVGQMMAGGVEANGARVYVALETVTGTLCGRAGSFLLVHHGTMTRTAQSLTVVVAPDSGTGELAGLSGEMAINVVEKKHFYVFDFALPD
ncbi:MAG TPA: DUF3224 domain-containing protein [Polyangiaceae bacterium]|jgi:hypothetical protein